VSKGARLARGREGMRGVGEGQEPCRIDAAQKKRLGLVIARQERDSSNTRLIERPERPRAISTKSRRGYGEVHASTGGKRPAHLSPARRP